MSKIITFSESCFKSRFRKMRLVECFPDQVLKCSKVLCASSYGHFIARTEFWSQCHILLLYKPKYIGPKGSRATGSRGWPKGQGLKGLAQGPRAQGAGTRAKGLKGPAQGPKGSRGWPKGQKAQAPADFST